MKIDQLKSRFAEAYYKGVNEPLSKEEDEKLRAEFRELEDSLMGKMPEKEFQKFYQQVHNAAWGNSCWEP